MAGHSQIGLSFPYMPDYACRDILKILGNMAATNYAFPAVLDENGIPSSVPATTISMSAGLDAAYTGRYVFWWVGNITNFLRIDPTGSPVITIHSGAEFVLGSTATQINFTGNNGRVEFSMPNAVGFQFFFLNSGSITTPLTEIHMCKLADEVGLLAGEIWTQDFLDHIAALNPKCIRYMDKTYTNDSTVTGPETMRPMSALSWSVNSYPPAIWGGTATGVNDFALAAAPSTPGSLTDKESIIGFFPNASTSTALTLNVGGRGAEPILNVLGLVPTNTGSIAANSIRIFVRNALLGAWISYGAITRNGWPLEACIDLANTTGTDLWYNLPCHVTDAHAAAIVQTIRDNLDPGLRAIIEYDNERWNTSFSHAKLSEVIGTALGFPADAGNTTRLNQAYAYRYAQLAEIMAAAWAPRTSSELVRMLALRSNGGGHNTNIMAGTYLPAPYNASPKRPGNLCEAISIARYIRGGEAKSVDGQYNANITNLLAAADNYASGNPTLMAAALDWLDSDIRTGAGASGSLAAFQNTHWPAIRALAETYDVEVYEYEGAFELAAPTSARLIALGFDGAYSAKIQALIDAYKFDSRMEEFTRDCYESWTSHPHCKSPSQYTTVAAGSKWATRVGDLYSAANSAERAIALFNEVTPEPPPPTEVTAAPIAFPATPNNSTSAANLFVGATGDNLTVTAASVDGGKGTITFNATSGEAEFRAATGASGAWTGSYSIAGNGGSASAALSGTILAAVPKVLILARAA